MGLLDDAIRNHIELKKRSGESPEAIEKIEEEVLSSDSDVEFKQSVELDTASGDESQEWDDLSPTTDVQAGKETAPDAEAEDQSFQNLEEEPEAAREPVINDSSSGGSISSQGLSEAEEDVVETIDEEVLEATPDFFEETPEHDQLWFEQKPPRDFDFND